MLDFKYDKGNFQLLYEDYSWLEISIYFFFIIYFLSKIDNDL